MLHALQVLDRKMKRSLTCSCADCAKSKSKAVQVSETVAKSKTKWDEKPTVIDLTSVARADRNQISPSPCQSCVSAQELHGQKSWSSSDHSQDYGYSSENNNCSGPSSPEGSEVACSDGFCNHEGEDASENGEKLGHLRNPIQVRSLQQMLEESCSSGEESYIPAEEVQEFKAKIRHVTEKRQELRQILKKRFAQMCDNRPRMRINISDQE